ncbi:MAG: YggT family protein [Pseudomonadota bacterium]
MYPFYWLFNAVISFIIFVIIIQAILSWLIAFNIVNSRNEFVSTVWRFTTALTDPIYRPIRRFVPMLGAVDITPLVAFFGLQFLRLLVNTYVFGAAAQFGL